MPDKFVDPLDRLWKNELKKEATERQPTKVV